LLCLFDRVGFADQEARNQYMVGFLVRLSAEDGVAFDYGRLLTYRCGAYQLSLQGNVANPGLPPWHVLGHVLSGRQVTVRSTGIAE
jgi:hypothetical protein